MPKFKTKSASHASPHKPSPAHQVRIIGGQWKRTPLPVLNAEGLRPTPDRVRETVFNWLRHLRDNNWSTCRCLDLFAGTGALGLEAASRGAQAVTLVDSFSPVVQQLEAIKTKLNAPQLQILRGDAERIAHQLANQGQGFDLIFLDPPFQQAWLEKLLPLCKAILNPGGIVYVEASSPLQDGADAPAWQAGWQLVRADRAGLVFYHLLQTINEEYNAKQ
jgi:16S rRNA (guanine966-N2)-methyltransferase